MRKDWFPTFSPRPILQIEQAIKAKTKNIKLHFAGEWPESSKLQAHSSNMVLMKPFVLWRHIGGICCLFIAACIFISQYDC